MKKLAGIVLIMILFLSCGKDEIYTRDLLLAEFAPFINNLRCNDVKIVAHSTKAPNSGGKEIVGTWKLWLDCSTGDTIDYSCKKNSALYHFEATKISEIYFFSSEGTLTIDSYVKEIPKGTFEYTYITHLSQASYYIWYQTLSIGEDIYSCLVERPFLFIFFVEPDPYPYTNEKKIKMYRILRLID
jgi:hypothetical protein